MCLAIPARLVELLPGEQAIVNLGGIRKTISIALIDDGPGRMTTSSSTSATPLEK